MRKSQVQTMLERNEAVMMEKVPDRLAFPIVVSSLIASFSFYGEYRPLLHPCRPCIHPLIDL